MILLASLLLQRFAIPFGDKGVDVVGPVGLCLGAVGVWRGALVFHRKRLILFVLLALWIVIGTIYQAMYPNGYGVTPLLPSLAQFLLLTSFCTLSFAREIDESTFFQAATDILMIVACAGIAQFALQFIGLRLFSFTGILPDSILYERLYNVQIPLEFGDLFKSNGFFLLEPSLFSQAMAMAMIIEVLSARRLWHLVVFTVALALSFSGTGWLVLGTFLVSVVGRLGRRGLVIAAYTVVTLVIVGSLLLLLAPDVATTFTDRFGEFSQPGTSGNLRFVTPLQFLHDVLVHDDWSWLFGIGAGVSEKLTMPYDYNVNTPIKILLEYGLPAVILYGMLFLVGDRTRLQSALVLPSLVLVLFAGGYQEFAPVLFPILLLICIARLRPSAPAAVSA
jgi:hypothetical protein